MGSLLFPERQDDFMKPAAKFFSFTAWQIECTLSGRNIFCKQNVTWIFNNYCGARTMNVVTERLEKSEFPPPRMQYPPITDHCDLSGKSHFHWMGQWPQGSETPLGVILYRCQEPEVSRGKMKAIHSSNDIGL